MRGDVKAHVAPEHGKVVRLFEDYGFAETPDGQEVYFHKNSVVDGGFDKLEVGSEVRLVIAESEGVEGVQASTVTPIGKHHIAQPGAGPPVTQGKSPAVADPARC